MNISEFRWIMVMRAPGSSSLQSMPIEQAVHTGRECSRNV